MCFGCLCYLKGDLALSRSASGLPIVCGFLTYAERLYNTSPGDYEGTFIKAADGEPRKGLGC